MKPALLRSLRRLPDSQRATLIPQMVEAFSKTVGARGDSVAEMFLHFHNIADSQLQYKSLQAPDAPAAPGATEINQMVLQGIEGSDCVVAKVFLSPGGSSQDATYLGPYTTDPRSRPTTGVMVYHQDSGVAHYYAHTEGVLDTGCEASSTTAAPLSATFGATSGLDLAHSREVYPSGEEAKAAMGEYLEARKFQGGYVVEELVSPPAFAFPLLVDGTPSLAVDTAPYRASESRAHRSTRLNALRSLSMASMATQEMANELHGSNQTLGLEIDLSRSLASPPQMRVTNTNAYDQATGSQWVGTPLPRKETLDLTSKYNLPTPRTWSLPSGEDGRVDIQKASELLAAGSDLSPEGLCSLASPHTGSTLSPAALLRVIMENGEGAVASTISHRISNPTERVAAEAAIQYLEDLDPSINTPAFMEAHLYKPGNSLAVRRSGATGGAEELLSALNGAESLPPTSTASGFKTSNPWMKSVAFTAGKRPFTLAYALQFSEGHRGTAETLLEHHKNLKGCVDAFEGDSKEAQVLVSTCQPGDLVLNMGTIHGPWVIPEAQRPMVEAMKKDTPHQFLWKHGEEFCGEDGMRAAKHAESFVPPPNSQMDQAFPRMREAIQKVVESLSGKDGSETLSVGEEGVALPAGTSNRGGTIVLNFTGIPGKREPLILDLPNAKTAIVNPPATVRGNKGRASAPHHSQFMKFMATAEENAQKFFSGVMAATFAKPGAKTDLGDLEYVVANLTPGDLLSGDGQVMKHSSLLSYVAQFTDCDVVSVMHKDDTLEDLAGDHSAAEVAGVLARDILPGTKEMMEKTFGVESSEQAVKRWITSRVVSGSRAPEGLREALSGSTRIVRVDDDGRGVVSATGSFRVSRDQRHTQQSKLPVSIDGVAGVQYLTRTTRNGRSHASLAPRATREAVEAQRVAGGAPTEESDALEMMVYPDKGVRVRNLKVLLLPPHRNHNTSKFAKWDSSSGSWEMADTKVTKSYRGVSEVLDISFAEPLLPQRRVVGSGKGGKNQRKGGRGGKKSKAASKNTLSPSKHGIIPINSGGLPFRDLLALADRRHDFVSVKAKLETLKKARAAYDRKTASVSRPLPEEVSLQKLHNSFGRPYPLSNGHFAVVSGSSASTAKVQGLGEAFAV